MTRQSKKQPITSKVFKRYEGLIWKVTITKLAEHIHVQRNVVYAWLRTAKYDQALDEGTLTQGRAAKRLALVRYLEQLKAENDLVQEDFAGANHFRKGEERNRLSRLMRHFYGLVQPEEWTATETVSKRCVTHSAFPRLKTPRPSDKQESLLWLQVRTHCVPLLIKPEWAPTKQMIALSVMDNPDHRKFLTARPDPTKELWPGLADRLKATPALNMSDMFNWFTYDLCQLSVKGSLPPYWTFREGSYFGQVNSGEALLWELALAAGKKEKSLLADNERAIPYLLSDLDLHRRRTVDPFDFNNRFVGVGINTLMIFAYRDRNEPAMFLMHDRGKQDGGVESAQQAAESVAMTHVIPAGIFQPYVEKDAYHDLEFLFKANVLRECCEEVLNKDKLFREMSLASPSVLYSAKMDKQLAATKKLFNSGGTSQWFLGCGLDLCTLKMEMLTLLIVNGDRWREEVCFDTGPLNNIEGHTYLVPFKQAEIKKCLEMPDLVPAGAGCLWFALEQFNEIVAKSRKLVEQ